MLSSVASALMDACLGFPLFRTSTSDARESETASARVTETSTGSHLFKVMGYSFDKGIGVGKRISSAIFTLGGYDWTIGYYPDGKSAEPKNSIAFDLNLRSPNAKAKVKMTLTLLSQTGGAPIGHYTPNVVTLSTNYPWSPLFTFKRDQLESFQYLKNDSFTVRCTLTVIKRSALETTNCKTQPSTVKLQPSNLHQQLTSLLEVGYGTDVSFNVSGVTFGAHRCVLAARSPVFRVELFGPMKGKMNESIEIKDMEPLVFKVMLHFIYSDSVPELEEVDGNKDALIVLAQHLLVAADRYGLERLKQLCEIKMYEFIDANNVATTLTLADQHNCSQLKAACIEFIKPPEVLAAVMLTEGFEHMVKSCPTILEELRKLKSHARR
ncbi:BTB/POZ/MATH-domain protein [Rhynchospora pubera]|uniref:BTB/POZ/MATH-domain protein n=1 Tax=Rhynchospora pubera TaxID=906938 RepID=A0AAV8CA00_9POAL|nr:BTB/POZ/MATH-domain protein [Rhynchospora pubera]